METLKGEAGAVVNSELARQFNDVAKKLQARMAEDAKHQSIALGIMSLVVWASGRSWQSMFTQDDLMAQDLMRAVMIDHIQWMSRW